MSWENDWLPDRIRAGALPLMLSAEDFAATYSRTLRVTTKFLVSQGLVAQEALDLAQAAWVRGWEGRAQLRSRKWQASSPCCLSWCPSDYHVRLSPCFTRNLL